MAWQLSALNGLVHLALAGSLFLAAGCLAVLCYRQPVRRVRLIELTTLGALLLPVASQVSWLPRWSTGWIRLENPSDLTPVARETEPAPGGVPPASALADAIGLLLRVMRKQSLPLPSRSPRRHRSPRRTRRCPKPDLAG